MPQHVGHCMPAQRSAAGSSSHPLPSGQGFVLPGLALCQQCRGRCCAQSKAQRVGALCRLVRPMLQQAEAIADDMDALALASTVSAVGRLKLRAGGLLNRLLEAALPMIYAFDARVHPDAAVSLGSSSAAGAGMWSCQLQLTPELLTWPSREAPQRMRQLPVLSGQQLPGLGCTRPCKCPGFYHTAGRPALVCVCGTGGSAWPVHQPMTLCRTRGTNFSNLECCAGAEHDHAGPGSRPGLHRPRRVP